MGTIMRICSVLKIASLAAALAVVAGVPVASAKVTKRPPDACIFHRHVSTVGTLCSYDCNSAGLGCSQQVCSGGHWVPALPCPKPFCSHACG
jgi:hypothetical protein